jgi:hypothetical protein
VSFRTCKLESSLVKVPSFLLANILFFQRLSIFLEPDFNLIFVLRSDSYMRNWLRLDLM